MLLSTHNQMLCFLYKNDFFSQYPEICVESYTVGSEAMGFRNENQERRLSKKSCSRQKNSRQRKATRRTRRQLQPNQLRPSPVLLWRRLSNLESRINLTSISFSYHNLVTIFVICQHSSVILISVEFWSSPCSVLFVYDTYLQYCLWRENILFSGFRHGWASQRGIRRKRRKEREEGGLLGHYLPGYL